MPPKAEGKKKKKPVKDETDLGALFEALNDLGPDEYDKRLDACNQILKVSPADADALQIKVVNLIQLSRNEEAEKLIVAANLQKVLAFEYAYVLYRLNKTGPAREVLATVPETEDTRESLRHLRAQISYKEEDLATAARLYRDIIDAAMEEDPEAMCNLLACSAAGDEPTAQRAMQLAKEHQHWETCFNVACTLVEAEKWKEADALLKECQAMCEAAARELEWSAQQLQDELCVIQAQQAFVLWQLGDVAGSKALIDTVLAAKPSSIQATAVAEINWVALSQEKSLFEACKKLRHVTSNAVDSKLTAQQRMAVRHNNAALLLRMGKVDACRSACDTLSHHYPTSDLGPLFVAALYAKEKKFGKAEEALRKNIAQMSEAEYKKIIRESLNSTMGDSVIPELGQVKKGKVRDIYFSGENVVMVASDRVSAFDYVLPNLIPFKGEVLNRIAKFAFDNTKDIVPNALVGDDLIDPNVVVQKQLKNCGIECIVRGYLWGSMAAAYEKGDRTFCGLSIPDGLFRFCKFDVPLFTPTTKAELGAHDENMTMEEVTAEIGPELAAKVKEAALKLYKRGTELAEKQGLIFIDTKYEFGIDEKGELFVIDEINTPDSSRLCDIKEWNEKYPKIEAEMKTGAYKNVMELLAKKPELKITEYSKQYVRDVLLEQGFKPGKAIPVLTEDQVVESAYRYIRVYERITGQKFPFSSVQSSLPAGQRLMANLQRHGIAKGACAVIMAGSDSDLPHLQKIQASLTRYGVPSHFRICSAHKQPAKMEELLKYYNRSIEPLVIVACAGGTDALSGTVSFSSLFPVVSCPPDGLNETCLRNPPGSSNVFVTLPDNAGKFVCQALSHVNPQFREVLLKESIAKVEKLVQADKYH